MKEERHPTAALVLPPSGGDWSSATAEVSNIPILLRNMHAAQKGGIKRFHIVISADQKQPVSDLFRKQEKLQVPIDWLDAHDQQQQQAFCRAQTAPLFVFEANVLFDPRIIDRMRASLPTETAEGELLFSELSSRHRAQPTEARVMLVPPAHLPILFSSLTGRNGRDHFTAEASSKGVSVPDHWLLQEIRRDNLEHAADTLLGYLGKPDDNLVIRHIRKISAKIAKPLADTPVRPNHVTLFAFLLGMLAALMIAQATYGWVVAGALLFVIAWIVDCADGMLARLKLEETRLGAWLDFVLDNVVHVAIFLAITQAVYVQSRQKEWVLFGGALLLFGALLSFVMVTYHKTHQNGRLPQQEGKSDRLIEGILERMIHRDFCLWILLLALLNHLELFFWAAVFGSNLFGGLLLYVTIRKGLFSKERRSADGSCRSAGPACV